MPVADPPDGTIPPHTLDGRSRQGARARAQEQRPRAGAAGTMTATRRRFLGTAGAAAAGALAARFGAGDTAAAAQAALRREVAIAGRRVRVIDIHAHCVVPGVAEVVMGTPLAGNAGGGADKLLGLGPARLDQMDRQGLDMQALSINGFWWYAADRDLAGRIVRAQNEGLTAWVRQHPDRFVAMASVALQHPDLAAEQLEDATKRLGMRGVAIGGHVNGEDLSLPKFDPFWAKAAELGQLVFMHPGGAENIIREGALRGRGDLGNIIGNPLETTYFLSRLIFDGTLDRFPDLRICAAHAGGYLPSYLGRTDVACKVRGNANCANKKSPREYFRRELLIDTMIFSEEGLRHLVATVGASQIVYGTDVPYNWPVTVDLVLRAPFLNDDEKTGILGGNLMKLLRIT
jgi:aminocarboxymuconate-semialdehyde decarboxylase